MTGKAARQATMLTAVMPDALVPQRHPIRRIRPMVDRVVAQLQEHFPQAAQMLADALPDILAFAALPVSHWQKLWSNHPLERLNKEIRRRRACPCRERGGHLPQPGSGSTSGGRGAGRATRRMGRGSPLPHLHRRSRHRNLTGQQHRGGCSITISTRMTLITLLDGK